MFYESPSLNTAGYMGYDYKEARHINAERRKEIAKYLGISCSENGVMNDLDFYEAVVGRIKSIESRLAELEKK